MDNMETKQFNELVNASYQKVRDILTDLPITCHHSKSHKFIKRVNALCNKVNFPSKSRSNKQKYMKQNLVDMKVSLVDESNKFNDKQNLSLAEEGNNFIDKTKKLDDIQQNIILAREGTNLMDSLSMTHNNILFPTNTQKINNWNSYEEASITDLLAIDLLRKDNIYVKYAPVYRNSHSDICHNLIDLDEVFLRYKTTRSNSKKTARFNSNVFFVPVVHSLLTFNVCSEKEPKHLKLYDRARFSVGQFYSLNNPLIRQISEVQKPPLFLKLNNNTPKLFPDNVEQDISSDSTMRQIKINYTLLESNLDGENKYPTLDCKCSQHQRHCNQAISEDDSVSCSETNKYTFDIRSGINDEIDDDNSNKTYTILNYDESDDENFNIRLKNLTYNNPRIDEAFTENVYEYSTQSRNEKLFIGKGDTTPQPLINNSKNITYNVDLTSSLSTEMTRLNPMQKNYTYPSKKDVSIHSHSNVYHDVNSSYNMYNRDSSYLPNNNFSDNYYMKHNQINSYNHHNYRNTCSYACNCTPQSNYIHQNQIYQHRLMTPNTSSINCGCNNKFDCPFRYHVNNSYTCPCYNEQYNNQVTFNQITYKQRYY